MAALVTSPVVVPAPRRHITLRLDWNADMAMAVQEIYNPQPLAANSTTVLVSGPCTFGGFLCTTAGSFQLTDVSGAVIVATFAVAVGQFVPAGFVCNNGAKVILSGGCAGTALYASAVN